MTTPAFAREFDTTLAVCSQFLLHGNIRDQYLADVEGELRPLPMSELLWRTAEPAGYRCLLLYNPVDGLCVYPPGNDAAREAAEEVLGKLLDPKPHSLARLAEVIEKLSYPVGAYELRAGLVIDCASRLSIQPETLEFAEHQFFVAAAKHCRDATALWLGDHERPGPLFNPVIWLLEREQDFPSWYTADNERVRSIAVPLPDRGDRLVAARILARSFEDTPDEPERVNGDFATQSDGLTLNAMIAATRLAKDQRFSFDQMPEAVRTYRLGVLDNPWGRKHLREQITEGAADLHHRVIGQDTAVNKTLDILKRSVVGLSGVQASSSATRPRGVLFFAGPTGVGKTELAKAITRLVFGDESAYVRFDMSEFASEHAGERLIGAPPGFIGYEAGGELTNAMRQQPFRVVLFDEVEKAHPLILDKFLQVLDEGRLSDGRGNTVHFSESVLVFTSNIGANNLPDSARESYEDMERMVKDRVRDYFVKELGRPELLNRFGDNIVVFGYIEEETAGRIFDLQLDQVLKGVESRLKIQVSIEPETRDRLRLWCIEDLRNGGRGIGSGLETHLVNPLSRALFDNPELSGELTVTGIERDGASTEVRLQ